MADTLTTTTQVDPAIAVFYDRALLRAAEPHLVHELFAQKRPIPKKNGDIIKFRRYANLTPATTPLTEGQTPPGQALSKTDLTAQISWYGDYVHVTDVVDLTVEDMELTIAAQKLGFQMSQTRDQIVRDILAACASATDASGGDNGGAPTELSKSDIKAVVMTLLGNNAEMFTPMIKAGSGVGTQPVRAAFWGIAHTSVLDDLEDVSGFQSVAEYPNQTGVLTAEWGSTDNVRWVQTSVGYSTGTPTQYSLPIIGKEAYGVTELTGSAVKNIVKPFGSGGTSDPLNQRATSGWKMAFVARILNDEFMHILKVTHSS